ncbi:hypothetical protein Lpp123_08907, partial [Lacticaseibacillus paracasei subsp. paracasei Lpp123]
NRKEALALSPFYQVAGKGTWARLYIGAWRQLRWIENLYSLAFECVLNTQDETIINNKLTLFFRKAIMSFR